MPSLKASFGVVAVVLLTIGPVSAQTTTGTITGRVIDGQGLPVPGATVSVSSPNLQGTRTIVTSANGDYVFPLLPPGRYALAVELSGFERQERTATLAPTQLLPLDVVIGVARIAETVTVVGRAADVITRTATVATNLKQDLLATLPTNRDINAALLLAPGVHPTGPLGAYSIAGAMGFDSLYLINGVTVNENLRGQPNNLYIEDAIQETTIATAGISAEHGRFGGGVVNVVTKSGGNLFAGSFRDTLNNDSWRALTPFPNDTRLDDTIPSYEFTLGGPVATDRLWFFAAGRFQDQKLSRQTAVTGIPYTFEDNAKRYEAKLTYTLAQNHQVQGAYTRIARKQTNASQGVNIMDLASLYSPEFPQTLFTIGYSGVLSPSLFIEARFSLRYGSTSGQGAPSTDLINGTLLLDSQRGTRYFAPTFCGVCEPEQRDNDEAFIKGSYFVSTRSGGAHTMTFGYDAFDDKRTFANHQSGSDYRITGTTSIVQGATVYPQFLPNSTSITGNPVASLGRTHFVTHSLFVNDNWRVNRHVTFNLGLRLDKNDGRNGAGQLVAKGSAWSPRLGIVWDPSGGGAWSLTGNFAKYVSAINNTIGDASSGSGNNSTLQWPYTGPAINANAGGTLVSSAAAIRQVFDWFLANGGTGMRPSGAAFPGVSIRIPESLASPNVLEYAGGISRQITGRAAVRADVTYRDFRDFYSTRIDSTTGRVTDPAGNVFDLGIVENTNDLNRRYAGLALQATYRAGARTDFGGNYTLSRLWGNVDGETANSGPIPASLFQYAEYRDRAWFAPDGDLAADQRHRANLWLNYGVPRVDGLTVSLLEKIASGLPYGAVGTIDVRPFVTNPGYVTPQGGNTETYFYTARDAFRTEALSRTDLAINYSHGIRAASRRVELFGQLQVLNIFNQLQLCGCGDSVFNNGGAYNMATIGQGVLSPANTATLARFNPFTTTPVHGTNWNYGSNFGTALARTAYTSPRMFRISFGVRF